MTDRHPAVARLAGEVAALNRQLTQMMGSIGDLVASNHVLGRRARRHSGWIFATAAGLILDLVLSVGLVVFYDAQTRTIDRLEKSIKNQCGFLALVLGSYRPESRPPEGRQEYDRSFDLMRGQYQDLDCALFAPLVPPATPPPR